MVEIWAERAKPISFSSKVLNIHIVWTMDERPIGPLTGVISVHFCGFKLMVEIWAERGPSPSHSPARF
jgi:hypothetical protein